ncbi:MAG: hypothetical protein LBC29_04085 [Propionibacteriaceae bacterium]|jgi:hypothetical protein|nr:hypothetical protein [Propionibacteriaceae bacterium]
MSTTHPADGSYIPKTKNADLLPFSVEVTSPNGDDKLVIAVKPRTAGGPIDFGLGEMGVVEGYGHVIRNGYLIVTAALTTPIMSQREQVEAGDISNVPMTFTIAAGPADTDSNLMPYRIFAPTSSGAVDISTYVNSDVFGYGWQTLGKRTLGECVAPWDSGWH